MIAWYVHLITDLYFHVGIVLPCIDLIADFGGVCYA